MMRLKIIAYLASLLLCTYCKCTVLNQVLKLSLFYHCSINYLFVFKLETVEPCIVFLRLSILSSNPNSRRSLLNFILVLSSKESGSVFQLFSIFLLAKWPWQVLNSRDMGGSPSVTSLQDFCNLFWIRQKNNSNNNECTWPCTWFQFSLMSTCSQWSYRMSTDLNSVWEKRKMISISHQIIEFRSHTNEIGKTLSFGTNDLVAQWVRSSFSFI